MSIKKLYYYLFYKLYKFWDYVSVPKFWSDWKAGLSLIVLEIWSIGSLTNYYNVIFHSDSGILSNIVWIIIVFILVVIDYFIFHHNDQWKIYNQEFDQLPKKKNNMGSWIVFLIVLLIISNFIFSFYLYYQT